MIKISEFTPAISSNREHTNTANCKVIINNNTEKKENETVKYPSINSTIEPNIPFTPMYSPKEYPPSISTETENTALFKHLAVSFSNILKNNNTKLIANIIDQSGKVIISGDDLAVAISLSLGVDVSSVKISFEDPEANCLGKVNPIKKITSIKINGYDFNLAYNKQFNTLTDEFGVSLTKVLIGI